MPIVVEKLNYTYLPGSRLENLVLTDVSLTLAEGAFDSLIGHTGSGKSTLIQHLNGLIQPASGRVLVDGLDMSAKEQRARGRRLVGMVFQYPEYQLFEETVAADVAFGPKNMGLGPEEVDLRVQEAMGLVGLEVSRFADKSPFELSGGEKRRVALAGILAMQPKYLVLDEPLAGLDPRGRESLLQSIRELRQRTGCAVLMVSHSMEDVARVSDTVHVLHQGHIALSGTPDEVFENVEELTAMGLDIPEAAKLTQLLKAGGVAVPRNYYTEEELFFYLKGALAP